MIALAVIAIGFALTCLAAYTISNSYEYRTFGTVESTGLVLGNAGLVVWILGFIRYAKAKGHSILLAIILALLSLPGLIMLLLLRDLNQPDQ